MFKQGIKIYLWVTHKLDTFTRQQARAKGGNEGAKFQICYINLSIREGVTNPQNSVNVVCESSFSSGWKELKLDTRYGIITQWNSIIKLVDSNKEK